MKIKVLVKIQMAVLQVIFFAISSFSQTSGIEAFLKNKMKELGIPGMQVAIVQHGKILMSKSLGIANVPDAIAVDNQTIFPINSCTKVFTGVAIMQLVEDGKLDLSAPVSRYLDSLPASWQPVTIRQLLTHISGLPDIVWVLDPVGGGLGALSDEAAVLAKLEALPMDFPTGTQFNYNQTNAYLLGKIIDKLSGKPFAQMFEERQFKVVGMPHTLFGDSRYLISHSAISYHFTRRLDGVQLDKAMLVNNYEEFAPFRRTGSGLYSTAEDMAKWIIALQQGKLLKYNESLKTLWSPAKFNNGMSTQWALGWGLTKFRAKHWAVGMDGGGRSAFLVYPDDGLSVIILTNLAGSFPENFIEELAGYFNPEIPASDPVTALRIQLEKRGFEHTPEVYNELKKKDPVFKPGEDDLNDWGYRMMGTGKLKNALEIFKLIVFIYPDSWNAFDSYGEALANDGQKEEAVKMYKKSLELNPNNEGGKRKLAELQK